MKTGLFLILICLSKLTIHAQTELDSLWGVWENESANDTARLKSIRLYIRKGYLFSDQDSARILTKLQYQFADKIGYTFYKADAINTDGISYAVQSKFQFAIEKYIQALQLYEQAKHKEGEASVLNNIGILYSDLGEYEKSIDYYERSLDVKLELGDSLGMASTLNNIGVVYKGMEKYDLALDNYQQCLRIEKAAGQEYNLPSTLINIAVVYNYMDSLDKAQETVLESIEIATKYDQGYDLALGYNTLALIQVSQSQLTSAIQSAEKAMKIAEENGYSLMIIRSHQYLYEAHRSLGHYKEALLNYELQMTMEDQLESEENQKAIIQQEYKYEYDKQHLQDSLGFAKQQELTSIQHEAELEKEAQQRYILYGGVGFLLLIGGLVFRGYQRKKKDNLIIKQQKEEVEQAHEQLEEKNQEILDSITYAKRIQTAILPPARLVAAYLPDSFVLYKPKDIVAGDFYWMEPFAEASGSEGIIFAAADCTGHGVPGAMVSVVCNHGLNRAVREFGLTDPAAILDKTRELVIAEFEKSEESVKDGMDIALVSLVPSSTSGTSLQYAGAHNPLWIIRKGSHDIEEIKADKQPIGQFTEARPFTTHSVQLNPGDTFYIFSDGFADQFGGDKGKKFKASNFKKLLLSVQTKSMEEQKTFIDNAFEEWKGSLEQLDDVCIIGVRIS